MTFNYTLTPPCSSAKPVKDEDPSSSSFGEVIKPIRYNGVGCPGVLSSTNYIINCNNGAYVGNSIDSCNGNMNFKIEGNQCQNYFPMEYEELKLENRFNNINFGIGHRVFVEEIKNGLEKLLDSKSLQQFYDWNKDFLHRIDNLGATCGNNRNRLLSGRIRAITKGNIINDGVINFINDNTNIILSRNENTYPDNWPDEIFWLELINGNQFGLTDFVKDSLRNNVVYSDDNSNYSIQSLTRSRKLLFPVLRNQITNLNTRLSIQSSNNVNRSQILNTPRFRKRGSCSTGSLCLDTTLTPSFKNSTRNMYLAPIPYGQRLGNTFRSSQIRGTKKMVRRNCVDPQFGRLVGTGGSRIVNKF